MILVVAGTGTGVGKTTFSIALIRALRSSGLSVVGWKPIETGGDVDARALAAASGAAGPAPGLRFDAPLAPSVAARLEGRVVDLDALVETAAAVRRDAEILVVETAGGLFSPLREDGATNAELAEALHPDRFVLVAANRLGVLHDVEACRRALTTSSLRLDVVILTGGTPTDTSVGRNAAELRRHSTVLEMPAEALDEAAARLVIERARTR